MKNKIQIIINRKFNKIIDFFFFFFYKLHMWGGGKEPLTRLARGVIKPNSIKQPRYLVDQKIEGRGPSKEAEEQLSLEGQKVGCKSYDIGS